MTEEFINVKVETIEWHCPFTGVIKKFNVITIENKEDVEKLKNVDAEHLQLKIVHKPMKSWYED